MQPSRLGECHTALEGESGCLPLRLMIEGQRSAKQGVADASETPQIALRPVGLLLEHLRSRIA